MSDEDKKIDEEEEKNDKTLRTGPSSLELDLSSASQEALTLMMDESSDDKVFGEILTTNRARPDAIRILYEHPRTPDNVRERAATLLKVPIITKEKVEELRKRDALVRQEAAEQVRRESLSKKLHRLGVGERIKMAQVGNSEVRGILLRDTNKQVVLTALDNPKITEPEVEAVARNRSIMEDALRIIAKNREWMKSYTIMLAMINNPKTPPALAMPHIKALKKRDLSLLEKNKNVSDAVRNTAARVLKQRRA